MRRYLQDAPTWVHSVVNGAIFGLAMAGFYSVRDGLWPGLVGGLIGGVLFGLVIGPRTAAQVRRAGQTTRQLSDDQAKQARRAVHRGPPPDGGIPTVRPAERPGVGFAGRAVGWDPPRR